MREIEHEPRPEFCQYCGPDWHWPADELVSVATIDGKKETVCPTHDWVLDMVGLKAGGTGEEFRDLADFMRDVIYDNAPKYFEMRSVKDLEKGL
jgi:hypothetical protein